MTSPTKKAPAKKTTAKRSPRAAKPAPAGEKRPGPVAADGTVSPVRIGQTPAANVEMVDVFEIDGHMWQVTAEPSPALMIQFQMDIVEFGQREAVAKLLVNYLGKPALQALAAAPNVSKEDVAQVFDILHHYAFGDVKGKPRQEPSDPS